VFEDPKTSCFTMAVVLLNTQSRGSVTLKSSNPSDPPTVDVGYLTHPYDKKALIAAVRESRRLIKSSPLGKFWKGIICAPIDESDEASWTYIQELISPIWHASSTITMGKQDDPSTCVNADMKVCGLKNIRVADMSVCPLTISGHTQAVAYLIAQTAAEKIIEEYELN
jgi:choline dehydrogenase-like flavoprotein